MLQLQVVSEARDVAKLQAGTKPRTVFLNIANRLAGEGSSAAGLNSSNFARTLQRDKSKKQGFPRFASYCFLLPLMLPLPRVPTTSEDVLSLFPDHLKVTSDKKQFLLYSGPVGEGKKICYLSDFL